MPSINEAFPSEYLRAADLNGRTIKVVIDDCVIQEVGRGRDASRKPILYFKGAKKGLALNKTNSMTIAAAYGDETDDWKGAEIELFPSMVDYQGKQVEAVRVRVPPRSARSADQMPPNSPTGNGSPPRRSGRDDMDDSIPF